MAQALDLDYGAGFFANGRKFPGQAMRHRLLFAPHPTE